MDESLLLKNFLYPLPEEKIAKFPKEKREESKLLCYNKGTISHHNFPDVVKLLPKGSDLYVNDTRVIPARMIFQRKTGAYIEIFLHQPLEPSDDMAVAMSSGSGITWECMVGNLKKWKEDYLELATDKSIVRAYLTDKDLKHVRFEWEGDFSFAEILEQVGRIPLPPYINRELTDSDKERYQTVYSDTPGAVAAPTAGLHFTDEILEQIRNSGNRIHYLTLHVGAGTFQPVKSENIREHTMHGEHFLIKKKTIESLLKSEKIIAVGTTSLRTLESLYWYGFQLAKRQSYLPFRIEPEHLENDEQQSISVHEALRAVLTYGRFSGEVLKGETRIFIYPGYTFRLIDGLITNFHMPGSTLIMLIATFIGEDWRKVYDSALKNDYRFLSYGDSSLLLP